MDLATLEPGRTLAVEPIRFDAGDVAAYREAVGAPADASGHAPPMAIAAWAMRSAMRAVELPAGAVHISQELEFSRAVPDEADLQCTTVVARNGVRRGVRFLVIEFTVGDGDGTALRGSATISIAGAEETSA